MKKYPSYLQSLIEELQSCELANEILERYQAYREDPRLIYLYSVFSTSRTNFFYSSAALSMIQTSLTPCSMVFSPLSRNSETVVKEENRLTPVVYEISRSTLWSDNGVIQKDQKTLKQLSSDVKSIVFQRRNCTYKEVADTIVGDQTLENEKNIRRRVYDAINVLTSVGIFEKKGKQIYYVQKNEEIQKTIAEKKETLKKSLKKLENFLGLTERNKKLPNLREAIQLPFILITSKKNVKFIQAIIRTEYSVNEYKIVSNKKLKIVKSHQALHMFKVDSKRVMPKEVYELIDS